MKNRNPRVIFPGLLARFSKLHDMDFTTAMRLRLRYWHWLAKNLDRAPQQVHGLLNHVLRSTDLLVLSRD